MGVGFGGGVISGGWGFSSEDGGCGSGDLVVGL